MLIVYLILFEALTFSQDEPGWIDYLDQNIPIAMAQLGVPGLSMSIVMGDQVITRGYGETSIGNHGQAVCIYLSMYLFEHVFI